MWSVIEDKQTRNVEMKQAAYAIQVRGLYRFITVLLSCIVCFVFLFSQKICICPEMQRSGGETK